MGFLEEALTLLGWEDWWVVRGGAKGGSQFQVQGPGTLGGL